MSYDFSDVRMKEKGMLDNLLADRPNDLPEELTDILVQDAHIHIERILSRGHVTPDGQWYDSDKNEWVVLLTGAAELTYDDGRVQSLKAGDTVLLPAQTRHRVSWTDPADLCVWLAVYWPAS